MTCLSSLAACPRSSSGTKVLLYWYSSVCGAVLWYKYLHLKRCCRTSFLEIFGGIALFQTIQGKRYPGDFQFDPLGLSQVTLRSAHLLKPNVLHMCSFLQMFTGLCLFHFCFSFFSFLSSGGRGICTRDRDLFWCCVCRAHALAHKPQGGLIIFFIYIVVLCAGQERRQV
jgi:hypothetical protein